MIGYWAIVLALGMTCAAAFFYFSSYMRQMKGQPKKSGIGGTAFYNWAVFFSFIAAFYMMYIIMADKFEYTYVFGHSSQDLPLIYKLSSFWAGQEGSFMLWLVFHVSFGLLITRKTTNLPGVMAVYSTLQGILLIILQTKSPFMMLHQMQADGVGLNPLLQDPWMVIHPPLIFLGYAGLAVPFSYAMEALLSRRHKEWISLAMPWTLFSWGTLGAGVFIGGFWAYKVLGWGGYWAWDPVENSSLVPWLLVGVLVHCLFLARTCPEGVKFAYFASVLSFISVFYGTFLTRSGILSDFSTHSFADEGIGGLLAGIVLIVTLGAFLLLILRWPSLPQGEFFARAKSRDLMLAAASLILFTMAVFVFVGMSTPPFTMLFGNPQSVSIAFYNTMFLPLTAVLVLVLAMNPVCMTGENVNFLRQYWWLLATAIGAAGLTFAFDLKQPFIILAISFSCTAILSSIVSGCKKQLSQSAVLAHVGVAVMAIGIIVSSAADQTVSVTFEKQQTQQVFGRSITYLGAETTQSGEGIYQNFTAESQGQSIHIRPYTKLNKAANPSAREPGIYHSLTADLYVAPTMNHVDTPVQEISLTKGEEINLDGLKISFIKFAMDGIGNEAVRVQALIQVSKDGVSEKITPYLEYRNGKMTGATMKAFGQYDFTLNSVNIDKPAAIMGYKNLTGDEKNVISVEISRKPLIILVWIGAALITISIGLAACKRLAG